MFLRRSLSVLALVVSLSGCGPSRAELLTVYQGEGALLNDMSFQLAALVREYEKMPGEFYDFREQDREYLGDVQAANTQASEKIRVYILKAGGAENENLKAAALGGNVKPFELAAMLNKYSTIALTATGKDLESAEFSVKHAAKEIKLELKKRGLPDTPRMVTKLTELAKTPDVAQILTDRDVAETAAYSASKARFPQIGDLEKRIKEAQVKVSAQQAKLDAAKKRLDTAK
jgi:hypothetical protein